MRIKYDLAVDFWDYRIIMEQAKLTKHGAYQESEPQGAHPKYRILGNISDKWDLRAPTHHKAV